MQGSQREGGEHDMIWLGLGLIALLGAIFFIFHQYILSAALWIKYGELRVIGLFVHNDQVQILINWAQEHTNGKQVQLNDLELLSVEVGQFLKWPCIILLIIGSFAIYFKHPDTGYRDIENMNTLANKIRTIFPAINVVHDINLVKENVDAGPWAMADTPIEFAKKHKLMSRDSKTGAITLDQNKAKLIFSQQLGEPFKGISKLKPHEQALFALFAAFANYKREEAEAKMEEICASLTPIKVKTGKINFNTNELLKKYYKTPVVQGIISRHAFINTIFMELLTEARKSGIVLNSLSLWLKPLDRKLWYVLNNVGRKAVFIEGAATQAHWLSERRLGFAISQPMIDEAVSALIEAIASRVIKDI